MGCAVRARFEIDFPRRFRLEPPWKVKPLMAVQHGTVVERPIPIWPILSTAVPCSTAVKSPTFNGGSTWNRRGKSISKRARTVAPPFP